LILGLVGLSVSPVHADNSNSSLSINNSIPAASAVSIDGGNTAVFLTENTTKDVIITATVTDLNNCTEITSVGVVFYRTNVSGGSACTPDNNNCYAQSATVVSGTCTGTNDMSAVYSATIPVQYYADPTDVGSANAGTDWTAVVTPTDGSGGTADSDTAEMATLSAMSVTTTILYDSLALGTDTGTTDEITTVTNTGNVTIGTQLDGYGTVNGDGLSMTCTLGTLAITYEKYHTTASTAYASKIALSDTATTVAGFSVAKATSSTPTTDDIYWGFGTPINGVNGACTGAVNFTPF
jgi:hypothetical protein